MPHQFFNSLSISNVQVHYEENYFFFSTLLTNKQVVLYVLRPIIHSYKNIINMYILKY